MLAASFRKTIYFFLLQKLYATTFRGSLLDICSVRPSGSIFFFIFEMIIFLDQWNMISNLILYKVLGNFDPPDFFVWTSVL